MSSLEKGKDLILGWKEGKKKEKEIKIEFLHNLWTLHMYSIARKKRRKERRGSEDKKNTKVTYLNSQNTQYLIDPKSFSK